MSKKEIHAGPGWLVVGVVGALAIAVISLAARNAKGKKQYDQLVAAIQEIIAEGRAKAEHVAESLASTGGDLAKDVKRQAEKAKHRLN
jgi:hypothetical protein